MKDKFEEGTTEGDMAEYFEQNQETLLKSLWKINVVDIEGTLSSVCYQVTI